MGRAKEPPEMYAFKDHRKKITKQTKIDKLGNRVDFRLTFEEWWKLWSESGVFHLRGRGLGKYVMSRVDDIGHYEVDNVFINSWRDNVVDGLTGRSFLHRNAAIKAAWVRRKAEGLTKKRAER